MQCKHCGKAFAKNLVTTKIHFSEDSPLQSWEIQTHVCAACDGRHIILRLRRFPSYAPAGIISNPSYEFWEVYPRGGRRPVDATAVPPSLLDDYTEACMTSENSAKSSAALSRRCLQGILWDQGYRKKSLAKQIDDLLDETDPKKTLPAALDDVVDAIRNYGNFAAHRITDKTTLQIIDVEEGEAETCLVIIEELFDYYYEKPAKLRARAAKLGPKLKKAGKPPAKKGKKTP